MSGITEAHTMRRSRLFGILTVIGLLAVIGGVAYQATLSHSPFLGKYRMISTVPWGNYPNYAGIKSEAPYTWLDNDTILYFVRENSGISYAAKQRVAVGQTFPSEPIAGTETSLAIETLSVSPDRKSLLIVGEDAKDKVHLSIVALDGRGEFQHYRADVSSAYWLADSQSVVGFDNSYASLTVYSAQSHHKKPLDFIPRFLSSAVIAPNGTYYASEVHSTPPNTIDLECGSVHTRRSHTRNLPRAENNNLLSVEAVSPQGDHLLWWEHSYEQPPLARLWNRMTGRTIDSVEVRRWYVTDAMGENRQGISAQYYPTTLPYDPVGGYVSPKWLPDGKHVSMVYKGALYVVPVPRRKRPSSGVSIGYNAVTMITGA